MHDIFEAGIHLISNIARQSNGRAVDVVRYPKYAADGIGIN